MLTRVFDTTNMQRAVWLLLAAGVLTLAAPRAAHAHPGHNGPALIVGAALGYALHDAYGRDRVLYYHDTHRHRGWRGCRTRSHFRAAPGYRHVERGYRRGYRDGRRSWRSPRYRHHHRYDRGHPHAHRGSGY